MSTSPASFHILTVLRAHAGRYVPVSELSAGNGTDRNDIERSLAWLQDHGYGVEIHPELGVRLISAPDRMIEPEILYGLRTERFGRTIYCYEEVGSTNDLALKLGPEGAPEGTLVVAERQTAGRGRMGRKWHATKGTAILASLVMRPDLPASEIGRVTILAGVSVAEVIRRDTGLEARLKWPNDVLIRGRKVCGILTERGSTTIPTDASRTEFVVVGIGLNVAQRTEEFPEELRWTATSLRIESGREWRRVELLQRILEQIEREYAFLHGRDPSYLIERWKRRSSVLGRVIEIVTGSERIVGRAVDLGTDGSLIVEREGGGLVPIFTGDVVWDELGG